MSLMISVAGRRRTLDSEEMAVFYKSFLDKNQTRHADYNKWVVFVAAQHFPWCRWVGVGCVQVHLSTQTVWNKLLLFLSLSFRIQGMVPTKLHHHLAHGPSRPEQHVEDCYTQQQEKQHSSPLRTNKPPVYSPIRCLCLFPCTLMHLYCSLKLPLPSEWWFVFFIYLSHFVSPSGP